jgi:hypothetical protein
MKLRAEYVIPVVILFFVIIISLCDSCMFFKPYDPEGYENVMAPLGASDFNSEQKIDVGASFPASAPVKTTRTSMQSSNYQEGDYQEGDDQEGFENPTLHQSLARIDDEQTLDIYSHATGGLSCDPSPYSNSKGYLCLDDSQKHALMTRGNNQT